MAIPHRNTSPLKSQVSCFLQSWRSSSRAFPYPFLSSSATAHFWKILLLAVQKVHFQKIPRSFYLRKHYTGLPKGLRLLDQQTKSFTKKIGVGQDIIWNIRACSFTATRLVLYQRSFSPFRFTTVHVQDPLF